MLMVPWKHVWSGDCVQLITLYCACARTPASDPSITRASSTARPRLVVLDPPDVDCE